MRFSAYTRGFKNDYKWSSPPEFNFHEYLKEDGVIVYRNTGGTFCVYLSSAATDKKDYQQRSISVSLLVSDFSESKAKGLTCWALQHFGNYAAELEHCIKYPGTDNWELNEQAVKQFIDSITAIDTTERPLSDRTENANTAENREQLLQELHRFDFSPKNGIKLIIDSGVNTGEKLNEIRSQVQRYLTGSATMRILEAEKKHPISDWISVIRSNAGGYLLPIGLLLTGIIAGLLFAGNSKDRVNLVPLQEQIKTLDKKLDDIDKDIDTLKTNLYQKIEKLNGEIQKSKGTQPIPQQQTPQTERKPLSS
jgi:hypothetical protein